MEELSEIIKNLDLECPPEDIVDYEFISVFKNPHNLPINQIHLEKTCVDLRKDVNLNNLKSYDDLESNCFDRQSQIIPALHKSWLPDGQFYFKFEPYNFTLNSSENASFISKNLRFLQTLNHLLACNYHHFWCLVLFEKDIGVSLHSFLSNPIMPYQFEDLEPEHLNIYLSVFNQFLEVYERLLRSHESSSEYMSREQNFKYLLDRKLLTLPIIITLALMYEEVNSNFVNNVTSLYLSEESAFREKEIEEMLDHVLMTLEMIGGHVCGFDRDSVIVPIAIEPRPKIFNLNWVYSVVNYLMNLIAALNVLLKHHKPAIELALEKGLPYRLSFTYERVFFNLYDMLLERKELEADPRLAKIVFKDIALARSGFIDCYNCFVTHSLDKVLECSGDPVRKDEFVEMYLKLMTSALEDEYFICDYHEIYDVNVQNEMFASCTEIDETRTKYIVDCITSFRRHNRIWKTLKCEKTTLTKAIKKYAENQKIKEEGFWEIKEEPKAGSSNINVNNSVHVTDEQIEDMVKNVIDMFPHLGDGFVSRCLEAYDYQVSDVISAILEENLAPHLLDIPFDEIRIPPEPEPEQPIEAYQNKKPTYKDALELLNDKRDLKQIKTFITEGLAYSNELYDDEYDDRQDEDTVPVRDQGCEDILRFNPNYDEAVSDTSYSENEYDEKGEVVDGKGEKNEKGKGNFCEDPAVVRARREARFRSQGRGRPANVVGKPKGQGQEKGVQQSRQKKNVQKSSKANHNRKSGAQWKRNKGMVPS